MQSVQDLDAPEEAGAQVQRAEEHDDELEHAHPRRGHVELLRHGAARVRGAPATRQPGAPAKAPPTAATTPAST